ncbi:MAG: hypothetical protein KKB31_04285, partial [Nanoarchaeota archaeon]|nr:hypothetical protein [Nanoarchaeota archaeon]
INWQNLPDANYYYNVTITDKANNINYTKTRKITLDDTKPTIQIDEPQAQNYATNDSMQLNYTATDNLIGLDTCSYYVYNSTGSLIIATTTLSSCQNTTFKLPEGDIDYTLTLFARDKLLNTQSKSVTFGIRTNSPAISLSPANDSHRNYLTNHLFNFTVSTNADSISACSLFHNDSGTFELNDTITTVSTTLTNSFKPVNLSEKEIVWNVNCTDNLGTIGWGLNNQTFIVDLTTPNLTINYITPTTGSQTFNFNTTVQDKYLDSTTCKYSIYNSLGNIDGLSNNASFNCNELKSATVTAYGTYNLKTYAIDKATNENNSAQSFTVTASAGTPGGGGGGGTIILGEGNWTMTSAGGGSSYEKIYPPDFSDDLYLYFENFGEQEREITLSCEDKEGQLCQYVSFDEQTFILPVIKDSETEKSFTISISENETEGTYLFNIVATDEEKRPKSISVFVNLGGGVFQKIIGRLSLSTPSGYPYVFIFLPILFTTLVLSVVIIPNKFPLKGIWVSLITIIIPFFVLYII